MVDIVLIENCNLSILLKIHFFKKQC